jgi:hypothetical protein
MKQKHQSIFLAGLLALAVGLSACSSMRGGGTGSGSSGSSGTGGETGSQGSGSWGGGTGSSGTSGTSGSSGSSSGYDSSGTSAGMMHEDQGAAGGATAAATTPNATVAAIEVMPRSSGTGTESEGSASAAMGSSAGGTTGSSPDRVYRITLRMDDGSTQVVTQQATPDFRTGDRVSLAGGVIQH